MDALTDTGLAKFQQQGSAQIHPVILSGGSGTRLWPMSRAQYPKQLLPLVSERTLLQEAALRVSDEARFAAPRPSAFVEDRPPPLGAGPLRPQHRARLRDRRIDARRERARRADAGDAI